MENIQKFQHLLKKLFQFETSDLDFGIYRILNYKRDQIKRFIEKDLVDKIESAFTKHKDERLTNIIQRFEEAKQKVIQGLGTLAFTPTGELKEDFKDTPLGRDFLLIKAQKDEAETIDEIKSQVFNDLYNFFSRYYEEGDFVPQYRYSIKGHKYAIPYNGEEVKLYWANNEQYYTKTGLLFRDYTFKANDYKVIFRIVKATEELGSKKATKQRFFILDDESPVERIDNKTLIIRFQYRELSEKEVKSYQVEGGSNASKQEKINQRSYEEVLKEVKNIELKIRLGKEYKNEKPLLLYQISRFAAKNTKDYFIHKNLKKFLYEQLDYFIKAEVLDIETLEKERFLDKHITRAKVVREIGEDIIDFLSQIEDFQKRLWEKKKFVLKTVYVITLDKIKEYAGEEFLKEVIKEVLKNKEQLKEWQKLGFDEIKSEKDLILSKNQTGREYKKLPIDTKYFSLNFKEKLLEKLTEKADLDDILDGLLIKSENWQALNLILDRYKGNIKCIYIDPPFNSKTTEILYKNFYKHSSWLSLMENRILQGKQLLEDKGVFICAIDENEQERLGLLLNHIFPASEKTCVSIVHNPRGIQGENFSYCHEYAYFVFSKGTSSIGKKPIPKNQWRYSNLRVWGGESTRDTGRNVFYPIYVKNGKIVRFGEVPPDDFHPKKQTIKKENGEIEVWPIDDKGIERKWRYSKGSLKKKLDALKVKCENDNFQILIAQTHESFKTTWVSPIYDASTYGTRLLSNMGIEGEFSFPKSLYTVKDCLYAVMGDNPQGVVLDFFAGSGTTAHAVMALNKEDRGKRKYVLVEMADFFDTVLIPRIKKVCYSFNWKESRPQDRDGISQFFKYHILEQYEDTLDNIELTPNKQAELKLGDDYLLKYFLDYETRESPYLLSINQLKNPFSYKLKVNLEEVGEPQDILVDVPETFNYLLGLKVKKIKARSNRRKYLFILGEKEGKDIAIVWREYDDNWNEKDLKDDKKFIIRELESWVPHIVYVNGQSVLTPKLGKHTAEIRYIEPEFKRLMG